MRKFTAFAPAFVVLLAVAIVLAAGPLVLNRVHMGGISARMNLAQNRLDQSATFLEQLNQATRDVASAVLPAVVHLQVRGGGPRNGSDDEADRPRFGPTRASAAGWFYSAEGFIVTNAHVVEGASTINVELYDGRVRQARVVGTDVRTDIALIKIDNTADITPIVRATGEPVSVGDRVFAFGSPFGIKFSMSQGIVSGLGRSEAAGLVGMNSGYTNFIQTDAAMNPGNSGGPLVDARGRVVGMSTAIANNTEFSFNDPSPQGQSAGIGFAVPIETIEAVVTQLMESSVIIRGYLGVQLSNYRADFSSDAVNAYQGLGTIVTTVVPGHPANKAGLEPGDIVVRVLGQPCKNLDVLRSLVSIRKPGTAVPLQIWRNGAMQDLTVNIGAAYNTVNERGAESLEYVEGSENMTLSEVRARIKGATADRVD